MSPRTAFLLRCSNSAAETVREKARQSRRSISGYVLGVLDRALHMEEILSGRSVRPNELAGTLGRAPVRETGTETAILVRCSAGEADRVRAAAKRKDMSISAFVMHCLRRAWDVETDMISAASSKAATRETVAVSEIPATKPADGVENTTGVAEVNAAVEETPTAVTNSAEAVLARAAKSGAS